MPITICHPIVSIPLRRFGLILSALIVGSMMPDFEFFIRLTDGKAIGHTIAGLFLFDIPVGLIVLVVFHRLIKYPLLSLLPHPVQSRLYKAASEFTFFPVNRFCMILFSLLIGAITHLLFDSFTHADGFFVMQLPLLASPVITLPQGTVRIYFLLQYGGSALSALIMIYWFLKWYYNENPINHIILHRFHYSKRIMIILSIGIFSIAAGITYGIFTSHKLQSVIMMKTFISHSAIASMSSLIFALITFGAAWHYWIPYNKRVQYKKGPEDGGVLIGENKLSDSQDF